MRVLTAVTLLTMLLVPACKPTPSGSGGGTKKCSTSVAKPQITERDDGKTICMGRKAPLTVTLHGTKADPWKSVSVSGGVLKETQGPTVAGAVTTAVYQSDRSGNGTLSASRKAGHFQVTIVVRS
jgi:hypothetical protein